VAILTHLLASLTPIKIISLTVCTGCLKAHTTSRYSSFSIIPAPSRHIKHPDSPKECPLKRTQAAYGRAPPQALSQRSISLKGVPQRLQLYLAISHNRMNVGAKKRCSQRPGQLQREFLVSALPIGLILIAESVKYPRRGQPLVLRLCGSEDGRHIGNKCEQRMLKISPGPGREIQQDM
jgi:hypothetical protein